MLNYLKIIEIFISIQSIFISTMIPILITIPLSENFKNNVEIPITLQIPTIILLTLFFNRNVVLTGYTFYLLIGLFIAPLFHEGGSLGYLLTPNFGYLIGIYSLIITIDNLNRKPKIYFFDFLKTGIFGICFMHIVGIFYSGLQVLFYNQTNLFIYIIGKYSLGKIGYHIFMLLPIALLIKPIIYIKNRKCYL